MARIINLRIEGMTCHHCVMHVQKALLNVESVRQANVDLEQASAKVEVDDTFEDIQALIKAVQNAGYSASLQ